MVPLCNLFYSQKKQIVIVSDFFIAFATLSISKVSLKLLLNLTQNFTLTGCSKIFVADRKQKRAYTTDAIV